MTQELDKNGRPKLYCANCGKRMAHTYQQQWFGCSGYKHLSYWGLREENGIFHTREDAEVELRRLEGLGYKNRGYWNNHTLDLEIDETNVYDSQTIDYYIEHSVPIDEPVPFQFHSQQCMMEFLQRPDIIRQILPIIEANKKEPIIPAKKPRKKPQRKIDLPDYSAMEKRILGLI